MQFTFRFSLVWICLACSLVVAEDIPQKRTINVQTKTILKDLSQSRLGANAQQFRTHYSIKNMLDSGMFGKFMEDIGRPVLRMDGRSIYGWFSKEEELKLKTAELKLNFLKHYCKGQGDAIKKTQPDDVERILKEQNIYLKPEKLILKRNNPDITWFDPVRFHEFCRKNQIKILGAVNDYLYYDTKTKKVINFRNQPEYYDGAVNDFTKKLKWVISHGYADLYVGWEIGNECWGGTWEPEQYAAYARKIINAAIKLQPDIKLAVPVMLRNTDDPWIKKFISMNSERESWFTWHEKMLPALGKDLKKVTHLQIHLYGFDSSYSANYRGLETVSKILSNIPNTAHLRYWVTEWRYTGIGGTKHRTFHTGALNNAKFAITLLSHPRVDYSTAHEFLLTSGLGYWTPGKGKLGEVADGSKWVFQKPEGSKQEFSSKDGKAHFDIGPFGPVNKMLNEIIAKYPLLVEEKADLGKMSSALFAEGKNDLQWMICTNENRSAISGCLVNSTTESIEITLINENGNAVSVNNATQMTCDLDKLTQPEIPGEAKFWRVCSLSVSGKKFLLPPKSISSFVADMKTIR